MHHQRLPLPNGWTLVLVDSITQLKDEDSGCVVVTGSHGGSSSTEFALRQRPRLACFNDSHESARIGDAWDAWTHGVISHANRRAAQLGLHPGMRLNEAIRAL